MKFAKGVLIAGIVSFGLLIPALTFAYALNGPWSISASVPWDGPWTSTMETASGITQVADISNITSGYSGDVYGNMVGPGGTSTSQTLTDNHTVLWDDSGLVSAGQGVDMTISGDWWVTKTISVTGNWYS